MLLPTFHRYSLRLMLLLSASLICFSCEKTDLGPVLGNYSGEAEVRIRDVNEILDNNGNFAGVEVIFDTIFATGDVFKVIEGDEDARFTVSGSGSLARINTFSNHRFTYEGQREFSVVDVSNGVENKRLEFSFDGAGNVTLYYQDSFQAENRPPTGQEILYSGSSQ